MKNPPNLSLMRFPELNQKNVFYIGLSRFNSLDFKRIPAVQMTNGDKERLLCYEFCFYKEPKQCVEGCKKGYLLAVVRRTEDERRNRKLELRVLYPHTKFQ